MTDQKFKAVVKESSTAPFLVLEPLRSTPDFPKGLILELTPETTYEDAAELGRAINRRLTGIQRIL